MTNKDIRIYVHVPFCESKCAYCDFASFVCNENIKQKYFDKLIKEIEECEVKGRTVKSIYFGGGTPSSVEPKFIESVMTAIKNNFEIDENAEITIECNPALNSFEKLKFFKEIGFNRVSFGVQSLDEETLHFLHRRHTKEEALSAIEDAIKAGFTNLSADLMIGVNFNGQGLLQDAETLIEKGVKHISAYMLQIEEGTPLYYAYQKDNSLLPTDDECVVMYESLVRTLKEKNFNQYEISNFALKGYESKHNLSYWRRDDYIGFGLSAHSFIDGKRFNQPSNFEDYFTDVEIKEEVLTKQQEIEEIIMLGLRCCEGFSIQKVKDLGYNVEENFEYQKLKETGYINEENGIIKLNEDFYGVSNMIIVKLLPRN